MHYFVVVVDFKLAMGWATIYCVYVVKVVTLEVNLFKDIHSGGLNKVAQKCVLRTAKIIASMWNAKFLKTNVQDYVA